jgi:uncharacterized membrane protein
MSAVRLRESVEVDRPCDEVWQLVADYRADPQWRAGVLTMDPVPAGPVTPMTTTAEQIRTAGRLWRNTGTVTAVRDGEWFTWRTTSGTPAEGARRVTPLGPSRTRVELELVVTPPGAQRLLRPLLTVLLRRTLRADAARLRALAEGGGGVDRAVPSRRRAALSG